MRAFVAVLVLLPIGLLACEPDCQESACDAARAPGDSRAIEQGVVGVVAYRTDACEHSCCACTFEDTTFAIAHLSEPVVDEAGAFAAVARAGTMFEAFDVHHRYERALEPGDYLLCYLSKCAALHVDAGAVFTVNLQRRYGPPSLIVFAPDSDAQRDDLVFDTDKE